MTIITISRGSYSRGRQIAEIVAAELEYECIDREIIIETSDEYNVPEIKLIRAIHDAPSILTKLGLKKDQYIDYFRKTFLTHMQKDNVVYHGLAGHFLLQGISHVLKVRIITDIIDRVQHEMERENISREEALDILKRDDEERRKWSQHLYGMDTNNPHLYDLVINVKNITVDTASEIICNISQLKQFQSTDESKMALKERL